jgi:energy-coupling factor transport system ATP-binding protein
MSIPIMPMNKQQIELDDVQFQFGDRLILNSLSLQIKQGEFVGIVGPNGSGKSTLARLLNGRYSPTSGSVQINGLDSRHPQQRTAIQKCVSLISADPENQLITSAVMDELAFSLQATGTEVEKIKRRCETYLAEFDLLSKQYLHPSHLSAGEQFRLLLAAMLIRKPSYLILDEISSMMDSQMQNDLLHRITTLKQQQIGIIFFTHRLEDLFLADRIYVLYEGQFVAQGTVAEIFSRLDKQTSQWQIETPFIYQLSRLISPRVYKSLPEINQALPPTVAPTIE